MAISVAQTLAVPGGFSGSFSGNVAAGDSVVAAIMAFEPNGPIPSSSAPTFGGSPVTGAVKITDNHGINVTTAIYAALWLLPALPGGAASVGFTMINTTPTGNSGLIAWDVAGLGPAPAVDVFNSGGGSGTAVSSGTAGPISHVPEFVAGTFATNFFTTGGPDVAWTDTALGAAGAGEAGYQIPVAPGGSYAYTGTQTAPDVWAACVAAIYAPPPAAFVTAGGGRSMLARTLALADI
ncbi:MAG TPA: hypothetical protein VEH31_27955 [Streptosporangiaceae bacterium]|nr:hypothetical protein [Streptosporangiaceae bacterium]